MENANSEPINEVNQSEQNQEAQYVTRQDIEHFIAQGIANAIPEIVAAVQKPAEPQQLIPSKRTPEDNGSNSINGGGHHVHHDPQQAPLPKKMKVPTPGCTYKEFLACKPTEFAGNEGATATLRWLEKTEAVIAISKCAEEDQVMYASNLFKE
ncbi:hypothetical protein Hanom_Chr07g00584271 [Helianthus anomalus]